MKKLLVLCTTAALLGASFAAAAAPGVGGDVTIANNKAGKVTVCICPFKGGELNMTAAANVNSVVVNGGEIKGKVTIANNTAGDVTAVGGLANVNSLIVNKK
jgi:hypothetical protein